MKEGRRELKYAVPLARRDELLAEVRGVVRPDPHGADLRPLLGADLRDGEGQPARGYRVNTMYLDTANLHIYGQRLGEERIRNVVRVRSYGLPGESASVFLESKRKLARRVVKHRALVGDTSAWAAGDPRQPWLRGAEGLEGLAAVRARRWIDVVQREGMAPVCAVHYLREVYVEGTARLTLDHDVRAVAPVAPTDLQGPGGPLIVPEGWMVLELKFDDGKPVWMRSLCARLGLAEEPVSKYALAVSRTFRSHRRTERTYLTPPSIVRAERAA